MDECLPQEWQDIRSLQLQNLEDLVHAGIRRDAPGSGLASVGSLTVQQQIMQETMHEVRLIHTSFLLATECRGSHKNHSLILLKDSPMIQQQITKLVA